MRFLKIVLTVFLFLSSFEMVAQQARRLKIDILLEKLPFLTAEDTVKARTLYLLGGRYLEVNLDSAWMYNQQSLALSKKIGYTKGIIRCNQYLGTYYRHKGEYKKGSALLERAFWLADSAGLKKFSLYIINDLNIVLADGGDNAKAIEFLKRGIKIAESLEEDREFFMGLFYQNYGNNLRVLHETDSALYYLEESYRIMKEIGMKGWSSVAKNIIGTIHYSRYNFPLALESYFEGLELATAIDYRPLELDAEIGIAKVYRAIDNTSLALERLQAVYEEELRSNIPTRLVKVEVELTKLYFQKDDYPKTIELGKRSIERGREINGNFSNLSSAAIFIALSYLKIDSLDQAMKYVALTDTFHQEFPNTDAPSYIAEMKARYFIALGQMDQALTHIRDAMTEARASEKSHNIARVAGLEYEYYKHEGYLEKALTSLELKKHLNDSIENLKNYGALMEISSRIETAKKELEIENQEKEISLLRSELRISQLKQLGGILGGVFIVVIVLLIFFNQRRKSQSRRQIARIEHKRLNMELELKQKEIASNTLLQAQKNQILTELLRDTRQLENTRNEGDFDQLRNKIRQGINSEKNLEFFRVQFEQTHEGFYKNLREKFSKLSPRDLQLCALIRLNFSNKEIASLLNIEVNSASKARHRLRQKMDLQPDVSLPLFLQSLV